jgi:hypothetical protein
MTAKQPFRGKVENYSIFFFLLIFTCISNISYAGGDIQTFKILAIGIHYQGQSDSSWIVKDVIDGPVFTKTLGVIQPALEMGVAGELNAGVVDKIALKMTITEDGEFVGSGWDTDMLPIDQATPPTDATNFLTCPGGLPITLEINSNKRFVLKLSNSSEGSVETSDM